MKLEIPRQVSRHSLRRAGVLGILPMMLAIAACGNSGSNGAGAAQDSDTFRVGALLSMTGPAGAYGAPGRDALVAVVDEANANGGIDGKKVELIVADDGSDPTKAVEAVNKLSRENLDAFIGTTSGTSMLAVLPSLAKLKIPLMTSILNEKVVDPAAAWHPYIFATAVSELEQVKGSLALAAHTGRRIAVVHSENSYGDFAFKTIQAEAGAAGVELVADAAVAVDATSVAAQVTAVMSKDPDVILLAMASPALASTFATALRSAGSKVPLVGSVAVGQQSFIDSAGMAGEGTVVPMTVDVDRPSPELKNLYNIFDKQGYKARRDFTDVAYTNAFLLLSRAVERSHDTSPAAIIDALQDGTCVAVYTSGDICYTKDSHVPLKADALIDAVVTGGAFKASGN